MNTVKTDRNMWIVILLNMVTCGIYSLFYWKKVEEDVNVMCAGDGKTTQNFWIAFLLGITVNYVLCVLWVFEGAREQSAKSRLGFFLTSAVGLLINELLMLLFRVIWGEDTVLMTIFSFPVSLYMVNKVIATGVVMIWNYFTKRKILKAA